MKKIGAVGGGIVMRYCLFAVVMAVIVICLQVLVVNLLRSREVKAVADVAASHMTQQLEQTEDRWDGQVEMFRSLVVVAQTSTDDRRISITDRFQTLATVLGGSREFEYAVLRLRGSKVLATFSRGSSTLDLAQADSDADGWRRQPGGQGLWRVKTTQLALPGYGAAELVLYFPVDESLLRQLRQPGVKLQAMWLGERFAGAKDMEETPGHPDAAGGRGGGSSVGAGLIQASVGFRVDLSWPRAPDGLVLALEAEPKRLLPLWGAVSFSLMLLVVVGGGTWLVMGGWLRREVVGPLTRLSNAIGMTRPGEALAPLREEGVAEIRAVISTLNSAFDALGRSQDQLAEGERRFRDFAGLNADLMWESNAEGRVQGVWGNLHIFPDIDPCLVNPEDGVAQTSGIDITIPGWSDYRDAIAARRSIRHAVIVRRNLSARSRSYSVSVSSRSTPAGRFIGLRGVVSDITNLKELEGRIRESERRMLALLDAAPGVVYLRSLSDMSVKFISSSVENQTGYSAGEIVAAPDLWNSRIQPEDAHLWSGLSGELGERDVCNVRYRFMRKDGDTRWFSDEMRIVGDGGDVIGVCIDVTDQVASEQRLQANQRMDAIGQLTGGLAHDFNNILGIVISSLEVVAGKAHADVNLMQHVDTARVAALRGADISRSLLAVARRQVLAPRIHDINVIVRENMPLIGVALGSDTDVSVRPSQGHLHIYIDAAGLVQCLVNIAVNARDAMEGRVGGRRVEIAMGQADVPESETGCEEARVKRVYLELRDSGSGMEPDVIKHAFEPFFTTKSADRGTGLGLAMVYGFVRQSGGDAKIDSVPGVGTTVTMCFPMVPVDEALGADRDASEVKHALLPVAGQKNPSRMRVLVVDDEEDLRSMACEMLNLVGCDAVSAVSPQHALDRLAGERFDFIFTDVTMPGMNGVTLARNALGIRSETRIVLTSGYPVAPIENIEFPYTYLQKPYLLADMRRVFCNQVALEVLSVPACGA